MSIHLNKSVIRWRCWPIEIITHRHPFDGNANRLVRSFGSATSTYSNNSSKSKNCKNNSFDNLSTNNTRNIMQFQVTSSNVSLPSGSIIIRSRLFSSSKSDEDLTATTTSTATATKTEDGVVRNNDEHTGTQINIIVEEEGKFAKKEKTDITDRSKYTDEVKIRMPDIGDGKGKILRWFRNEGDIVRYEDVLCDIETEDFTFGMQIEDEELAIMGKILVDAPSGPVNANDVICILLHKKENDSAVKDDKTE